MPRLNEISPKQKKFADKFLETGEKARSALKPVYNTEDINSAAAIASQNLKKLKVIEYIEGHAPKAAKRIVQLSNQEDNLPVALNATKDILDRSGFKPVEKTQSVNVNVEVKLNEKTLKLKEKYETELKEQISNEDT